MSERETAREFGLARETVRKMRSSFGRRVGFPR
jgi:hypothetical protein